MSPDYSQATKFADDWLPVTQGHDGAFWMSVNHVILKEYYADRQVPFFEEYARKYTDLPFLVKLGMKDGALLPGEFLRADELERSAGLENAGWTLCVADAKGEVKIPHGSLGSRWSKAEGKWNLEMKKARVLDYTGASPDEVVRALVRALFTSVADTVVVPVQDRLDRGPEARMTVPGRSAGNWSWRLTEAEMDALPIERLRRWGRLTGRAAGPSPP